MMDILDNLVGTVNSIGSNCFNIFSSFITLNYFVGDILFNCIKAAYLTCYSTICTLLLVLRIMLEDLLVFFQEISEALTAALLIGLACFEHSIEFVSRLCEASGARVAGIFGSISSVCSFIHYVLSHCVQNFGDLFNLIGKSIILLVNLVPRTIYLLYLTTTRLLQGSKKSLSQLLATAHITLTTASPELVLGSVVCSLALVLLTRYTIRTIRERSITWRSVLRALLWLVCTTYILIFSSIARCMGLTLRAMELTVSNLRVPMFAHAGDSDDEEEDRENLLGALEDSDDEENERQATKRKNYEMLRERASRKRGSRRGSIDSMEDQLMREVEREREDKLCCICQDQEKCIMMLPCRHLCICSSCQEPLRTHRNTCPICRKQVKQMIKAYL